MKRLRILLLAFILIFQFVSEPVFAQFLKTEGQKIVNMKGENVLLRGMGLGGWMLQEGYMLRVPKEGQQHKIKERIVNLIGEADAGMFYDIWLKNHTQKIDIDSLRHWGFNSVRLPMHFNLFTLPVESEPEPGKNTWLEKGFAMTDNLLAWCRTNQMYLILDLHAAPGGQGSDFNISDRNPATPSLWESRANQEKTIALWRKLAERYVNEPFIGGYDILNEPNYGFENLKEDPNGLREEKNEPLRKLSVEITNAIREVDKNHIIIIEGNGWGNNYKGMLPVWDKNMVLSFHKYWNNNDLASIQHILDMRSQQNVPVWLGETGENSNVWFTACISLLEKNNIGWAWWPLKKLGSNNPLEVNMNPDYQNILDYWNGKSPKPERHIAIRGLIKLASDLKLENNTFHKDVIDAMFRQPHSTETLPFRNLQLGAWTQAVDYDLGRNSFAYYDTDSANYRVVKGQQGGNKGRVYRNDGVDIRRDSTESGTFYVSDIEVGEWLQYTITAKKGTYSLDLRYRTPAQATIAVLVNGKNEKPLVLPLTNTSSAWSNSKMKIALEEGSNKIKILFKTSGIEMKALKVTNDKR